MGKAKDSVLALRQRPFDMLLVAFYSFFLFTSATTDYHVYFHLYPNIIECSCSITWNDSNRTKTSRRSRASKLASTIHNRYQLIFARLIFRHLLPLGSYCRSATHRQSSILPNHGVDQYLVPQSW
jgi:hypothetical protein